jgi:hypothetical protein
MESGKSTTIVVTEQAGEFAPSIERLMPGRADVTIVSQSFGESPGTFAERVTRKVAKLGARERPMFAVICCGMQGDDASWDSRARVADSLLSSLEDGGELIFTVEDKTGRRSLPRFLELVAATARRHPSLRTSVRFG